MKKEGIKPIFRAVRHAQSNESEGIMKELSKFFKFRVMVQHKHTALPNYLETIEYVMNKVHHKTTEFTPMEFHKKPTKFRQKYIKSRNNDEMRYNEKLFLAEKRIRNKR